MKPLFELSGRFNHFISNKLVFADVFFKTHWQERAFLLEYTENGVSCTPCKAYLYTPVRK